MRPLHRLALHRIHTHLRVTHICDLLPIHTESKATVFVSTVPFISQIPRPNLPSQIQFYNILNMSVTVLCTDSVNTTESVIDGQVCSNGGTTLTDENRRARRKTI